MKKQMNLFLLSLVALALGIPSVEANEAPKPAVSTTPSAVAVEVASQAPQSVFVIPASPKEGRNPFFPRSKAEAPVVTTSKAKPDLAESAQFVLNGITSPPKRMAMINGRTFEVGEIGEVKIQNGAKISIQCVEIRNDAAIIVVGTQRRELRLRNGV